MRARRRAIRGHHGVRRAAGDRETNARAAAHRRTGLRHRRTAHDTRRDRTSDRTAIEQATNCSALVTIVDDAHRLDDATLLLLERLAKRASALQLMLVVTARAEERASQPRLAASLARIEGAAAGFAMRLMPLPDAELEPAIFEAVRGIKPLTARDRDALLARAAGSPYFVEELLRAYVDGISPATPSPTLAAAIVERFRGLDPVAQSVLRVAAAIGRSFDIALLARIVAIDEATLFVALRSARDSALILETETGATFVHAIAREAIEGTFDPQEQRATHRELAALRGDAEIVERAGHALPTVSDVRSHAQWPRSRRTRQGG